MKKRAYIIFTRIPTPNKVKTRLQAKLTGKEASQVQAKMLQDLFQKMRPLTKAGIDLFVAYSNEAPPAKFLTTLPPDFTPFPQKGADIGERMAQAFQEVFAHGYAEVILTGSDIPQLNGKVIKTAFASLQEVVIGPTLDGGYYLIGCRKGVDLTPIFLNKLPWGQKSVLQQTLAGLANYQVAKLPNLQDVDYPEDLKKIEKKLANENRYLQKWLAENRGILDEKSPV